MNDKEINELDNAQLDRYIEDNFDTSYTLKEVSIKLEDERANVWDNARAHSGEEADTLYSEYTKLLGMCVQIDKRIKEVKGEQS